VILISTEVLREIRRDIAENLGNQGFRDVRRQRLTTPSFSAAHTMLSSAFTVEAGNVIETHEHKGDFKEW